MSQLLSLSNFNAILIGLTFLCLGLLIGFSHNSNYDSSAAKTLEVYPLDLSNAGIHWHDEYLVSDEKPSINVVAHRDEMMPSHFNLELKTENFEFTPENISQSHVQNEGHAHVYVDDVLISRSYSDWYHLPRLEPGNHTVRVTLNTNNHKEYKTDEGVVEDEVVVRVPKY